MDEDPAEKMVGEGGETEFARGIVKQIGLAGTVPQGDMGVAAAPGQMHKRLWHEGRAQPMLPSELLDHEFEEHVAIGGHERIVISPIHLEFAGCVLVIALIWPPAHTQNFDTNRPVPIIMYSPRPLVVESVC